MSVCVCACRQCLRALVCFVRENAVGKSAPKGARGMWKWGKKGCLYLNGGCQGFAECSFPAAC